MKKIAVVTSGGDAPGMNAAIRAVTRVAYSKGLKVVGFHRGWEGLMKNKFTSLTPRSVGGILGRGGTILYTARSPDFRTIKGVKRAAETLAMHHIDGLVVIGGDGSIAGAYELSKETNTSIVVVPASIDNDVFGTDETIGFDTAVNTAMTEIDKIRDTAMSHERIFIIEVMGRKSGFIALTAGITAGAEVILIPEAKFRRDEIFRTIKKNEAKGKKSSIVVAAEGVGNNRKLARDIEENTGSEVRLSVLGYAQRGGSPTARSRLLACLFGNKAIELLSEGQRGRVVGIQNGKIASINLEKSCKTKRLPDLTLLQLANKLAT
ncbi:MAG: 6-phosphofructokinase [Candidatus Bathyarchaeota archaeon]|nr:MAG: 6-phosphofructokinase [Candidatus Bathyarchaeota archaeon]